MNRDRNEEERPATQTWKRKQLKERRDGEREETRGEVERGEQHSDSVN